MGDRRSEYRILVGRPEGWRPLGRPRYRWEDNIKMHFQEVKWKGVDWIALAQACDFSNKTSGSTKCGEFLASEDLLASKEGPCSTELLS
jgi:hypothetical protein